MARPEFRVARFGDDHSYSDIATRRLFGGSANVVVLEDFDGCLEAAAADGHTVAMVPVHNTANKRIVCADSVPVMDRARSMGLRVLATLELPVDHVLASFGGMEDIAIVYSKDEALAQCSRIIERHGWRQLSAVPGIIVPFSTSGAARYVAGRRAPSFAAICSEDAAEHYGVPIVKRNIADSPDNKTTFHAYVRADSEIPAPGPRGP